MGNTSFTRKSSGLQSFANAQQAMRGVLDWQPIGRVNAFPAEEIIRSRSIGEFFVDLLEKMMECSGPNFTANLERAMRQGQMPID